MRLDIGCHLSASAGYLAMGKTAVSLGANTFQFFTRNPRGGKAKALDGEDLAAFHAYAKEHDIRRILAHAPYTMNLCAENEQTREFARMVLKDDLERMEATPGQLYNLHPGSHVGQGMDVGIAKICEVFNEVLTEDQTTTVLLETMSGKGSEVGSRFEELRTIIDGTRLSDHLGVCLDTCHVYDGGYDIVQDLDGVLEEFDRILGLDRLRAIHINDSMNPFASHKDRHQKIGQGSIGLEAFARIVCHPALRNLPFYLETPNELEGYAREIACLREIAEKN